MAFPKSFQVGGAGLLTIRNVTSAYTVLPSDKEAIINCTSGTFTVSLTAAATLGSGFNVTIWNTSTTSGDNITIDPAGVETIDGLATLILRAGEGMQVICNGTNWDTGNKKTMRGYAENFSNSGVARPIASGNLSTAIGRFATASGIGSFAYNYGSTSSNDYTIAFGASTTASAAYSTAIGGNSFTAGAQAVGTGAVSLGASYASGTDSFATGAGNNSSSYGAKGPNSVALGHSATASGTSSAALGGTGNIASATRATAIGGIENNATGLYSYAYGFRGLAAYYGKYAYGVFVSGTPGDAQGGYTVLATSTTDATASKLWSDGGGGGSNGPTNQVILANNQAIAFTGTVVARQSAAGGTASAAWKIEGLIRREANAGTTVLVASAINTISNVPGWAIALTADTTNGGLAITATGAAATNIRWVATVNSSEIVYA